MDLPIRMPNPSPTLEKISHPWVQEFYPVLGLGSGGRLLGISRLQHYTGYISICETVEIKVPIMLSLFTE